MPETLLKVPLVTSLFFFSSFFLCWAQSVQMDGQHDPYEGLRNEMTRQYGVWQEEHKSFDLKLAELLQKAASNPSADQPGLCTNAETAELQAVVDLYHKRLAAERRYYQRHHEDAENAIKAEDQTVRTQTDLEKQRQMDLQEAQKELQFLHEQQTQLLASKKDLETMMEQQAQRQTSKADAQVKPDQMKDLNNALEQLDHSIQNRDQKIKDLQDVDDLRKRTRDAIEVTRRADEFRLKDAQDALSLIDAHEMYWESYYSMRRAQIAEFCKPGRLPSPPR